MRVFRGRPMEIPYSTRMGIATYTWVLCALHARAITRWWSACMCSQYLGMVELSESAIVDTELRFDRKLQEANVDQSEGVGELQASRPRWLVY